MNYVQLVSEVESYTENTFDTNDIKKRNLWFLFFIFVSCSRSFYHITLRALKNWFNLLTASTRFSMEVAYEIRM